VGGIRLYPAHKGANYHQEVLISFARLDLSEVHLWVLEWAGSLLREQRGLGSLSWVMLGAAQASLAG
jgi:hypothetical protein